MEKSETFKAGPFRPLYARQIRIFRRKERKNHGCGADGKGRGAFGIRGRHRRPCIRSAVRNLRYASGHSCADREQRGRFRRADRISYRPGYLHENLPAVARGFLPDAAPRRENASLGLFHEYGGKRACHSDGRPRSFMGSPLQRAYSLKNEWSVAGTDRKISGVGQLLNFDS